MLFPFSFVLKFSKFGIVSSIALLDYTELILFCSFSMLLALTISFVRIKIL